MLRLSIESWSYVLSQDNGQATRAFTALASIPEGISVHDSLFSGPVYLTISDRPIASAASQGSIYWDVNAFGDAAAHVWLCADGEVVDRIADKGAALTQIGVSAQGALVNRGSWPQPEEPAAVSGFSCTFNGPAV
ncbi:hypothetical protein ABQ179_003130 [Xanthomonas dyei]|uniref:hypothetical protein n=1 Tax=Xanthomonas dyei TaxID=743699 RepID=UPI0032E8EDE8